MVMVGQKAPDFPHQDISRGSLSMSNFLTIWENGVTLFLFGRFYLRLSNRDFSGP